MNKEIAELFDTFYQITLKDQIKDPIIHSEWVYFMSMVSNSSLDKERIKMYLNILENQKKKKSSVPVDVLSTPEPKFEKRYSEPYRYGQSPTPVYEREESNKSDKSEGKRMNTVNPYKSSSYSGKKDKIDIGRMSEISESLLKVFEISVI